MKVLSIDPGYDRLGIAIIEKTNNPPTGEPAEKLLFSETFSTDKKLDFIKRLFSVVSRTEELIEKYQPKFFAIEKLFFNTNQKTATNVAEVRGALIYVALKNNLKVYEYTPLQIKVAVTGYGRADKKQVIFMLEKLIKINKTIQHDDEYDAIACGLTFLASEKINY